MKVFIPFIIGGWLLIALIGALTSTDNKDSGQPNYDTSPAVYYVLPTTTPTTTPTIDDGPDIENTDDLELLDELEEAQ